MALSNAFYLTESTEKTATNRDFKFEDIIIRISFIIGDHYFVIITNRKLYFISVQDYL